MISVTTLGKFQIVNEYGMLNDENVHSAMLTKLLIFLIAYREKNLTTDEIAEALWHDEEVENPAGALKNLMYRLRKLLKNNLGNAEFIITNRGSYCWNPEEQLIVDAEQFEHILEKAKLCTEDISAGINYYERGIQLYQGDFMSKLSDAHWAAAMSTYYHSLYLSAIKSLAEIYIEAGMFDDLESLCNEALKHDATDEQLHYFLILARMKNHKLKLAMESYEKACDILMRELGVRKPAKLQKIYQELLQMNKGTKAEKMEHVQEDMMEENPEGAFFCGYPVFREIYRLEARKGIRNGETEYVLLLTMKLEGLHEEASDKVEQFRMKKAMSGLENTLKTALRIGDVVSKYSDSQFVILLPYCSYECGMLVANRIISRFYDDNPQNKGMSITINLEEVTVAGTIVQ